MLLTQLKSWKTAPSRTTHPHLHHLRHHFLGFFKLIHQLVDVLHLSPRTLSNS